jgi:hypothetical protein
LIDGLRVVRLIDEGTAGARMVSGLHVLGARPRRPSSTDQRPRCPRSLEKISVGSTT